MQCSIILIRGDITIAVDKAHIMYEKAKEDHTFRTDIPFEEFMRETVHVMMAACTYYANGFIWGADEDENYVSELKRIKGMIVAYVRNGEP